MSRTAMMGRGVVLRGGFSLYLSIDEEWREVAGLDVDDTCRLGIEEIGDSSLTVALFIGDDYDEVEDPPGQFDIDPVDIKTDVQWCLPQSLCSSATIMTRSRTLQGSSISIQWISRQTSSGVSLRYSEGVRHL
ncbi:hypothetical protein [Haloarcula sp. CBA1127]|uniref:hypothetical protein n=1 Tax=Haloarcula sp. CBA1127 TaxID=1765055 RepID=UPI000B11195C|nr:hypothetical protein [Haloarcula sp. CBA1127]